VIGLAAVTACRIRYPHPPYLLACRFFINEGPLPDIAKLEHGTTTERVAYVAAHAYEAPSDWDLRPLVGLYTRLYFDHDSNRVQRIMRHIANETQAPVLATWPSTKDRGLVCENKHIRPATETDSQAFLSLILGWPHGELV
jgi:hypothetical protein